MLGVTGLASGSMTNDTREHLDRYRRPDVAREQFDAADDRLLERVVTQHVGADDWVPLSDLIDEQSLAAFSAPVEDGLVTHLEVEYDTHDIEVVRHVERERTVVFHHGGDGVTGYVYDRTDDEAEPLSCYTAESCCTTCGCEESTGDVSRRVKRCCCCGPKSFCSTSRDGCCTQSDDGCNLC